MSLVGVPFICANNPGVVDIIWLTDTQVPGFKFFLLEPIALYVILVLHGCFVVARPYSHGAHLGHCNLKKDAGTFPGFASCYID